MTLIILCAGNSSRFEHTAKKQWIRIENEPLWLNVTKRLSSFFPFEKIIVASHENELNYMIESRQTANTGNTRNSC